MDDIVNNYKPICPVCNKEIEPNQVVNHHISYFPEKTIPVHKSCHNRIHQTSEFQHLKPKKGEAEKFYQRKRPKKVKINLKEVFKEDESNDIFSYWDSTAAFYALPRWLMIRNISSSSKIIYAFIKERLSLKDNEDSQIVLNMDDFIKETGMTELEIIKALYELVNNELIVLITVNFEEFKIALLKHKWMKEFDGKLKDPIVEIEIK